MITQNPKIDAPIQMQFCGLTVAIKLAYKTTVPLQFDNVSSCTLSSHRYDIILITLFGKTSRILNLCDSAQIAHTKIRCSIIRIGAKSSLFDTPSHTRFCPSGLRGWT